MKCLKEFVIPIKYEKRKFPEMYGNYETYSYTLNDFLTLK